ncbi:TatD family hydrolase [Chloroflexota bacterium]
MKSSIIDTHAHLDMTQFDIDRTAVINRASNVGVSTIITVGIDLNSSKSAIRLAESYTKILATVGFHPHEVSSMKKMDIDTMTEMATHPKVVAIGEIGLDYYRNRSARETQVQALRWQLEIAERLDLPVIVHCRQADESMFAILHNWAIATKRTTKKPRGVIHCFSGSIESAQKYLSLGFFIAFGGYVGYSSSIHLRSVIASIPEDKLVVETDCPFLPPQKYRGQRNESSYLPLTVAVIAEARGLSLEAVARSTTENACRLFGLSEYEYGA